MQDAVSTPPRRGSGPVVIVAIGLLIAVAVGLLALPRGAVRGQPRYSGPDWRSGFEKELGRRFARKAGSGGFVAPVEFDWGSYTIHKDEPFPGEKRDPSRHGLVVAEPHPLPVHRTPGWGKTYPAYVIDSNGTVWLSNDLEGIDKLRDLETDPFDRSFNEHRSMWRVVGRMTPEGRLVDARE